MGEKETMTGGDAAARAAALNVSASPGGSPSAGILSAAVSSVSQLSDPGGGGADVPAPLQGTTVKSSKSNSSE